MSERYRPGVPILTTPKEQTRRNFYVKVFDTMALLETDRLALVKVINAIEFGKKQ
jgi:hypothetical protein